MQANDYLTDTLWERGKAVAREIEGAVTLVLGSRTELRLGDGNALPHKLRVAAGVLRSLSPGERATLRYLDVSLPARPVAGI